MPDRRARSSRTALRLDHRAHCRGPGRRLVPGTDGVGRARPGQPQHPGRPTPRRHARSSIPRSVSREVQPFAPSVLEEPTTASLPAPCRIPFMVQVYPSPARRARDDSRVTHVRSIRPHPDRQPRQQPGVLEAIWQAIEVTVLFGNYRLAAFLQVLDHQLAPRSVRQGVPVRIHRRWRRCEPVFRGIEWVARSRDRNRAIRQGRRHQGGVFVLGKFHALRRRGWSSIIQGRRHGRWRRQDRRELIRNVRPRREVILLTAFGR